MESHRPKATRDKLRPTCWKSLLALVLLAGCGSRTEAPVSEIHAVRLRSAPDALASGLLGRGPTLLQALDALEDAAQNESCRGVFLEVGGFGGAWGRMSDLSSAVQGVRESGKLVHCHFAATDNAGYALLASSCDRISMSPAGDLNLVGLSMELVYLRELLENVGAVASVLHVGRFKGAGDMLTESEMPESARESLSALLDDLDGILAGALRARELDAAVLAGGPYTSERAKEAGLVDDVAFVGAAQRQMEQQTGASIRRTFPAEQEDLSVADLLLNGRSEDEAEGAHIVVATLQGSIQRGAATRGGVAAGPTVEALDGFTDDDEVKAVVLRIESPGGSVIASDQIWGAVRRLAEAKPVIVSMGDVAASGGYYIASAAHRIFSAPGSVVGSIGVVGGKVTFGPLAERLGVRAQRLTRGPRAAMYSPFTPFSDDEADAFLAGMRSAYYRFLRRVAAGRGMTQEEVAAGAEGRAMSGRAALELGLVDELGGLQDALRYARNEVDGGERLPTRSWPESQGPAGAIAAALSAQQGGLVPPLVSRFAWMPELLMEERMLAALPIAFEVH